jgi:GT2 family glycosyltransferase
MARTEAPASPIDVLIPTRGRPTALAATMATLIGQTHRHFDVVVADQSDGPASFDTDESRAIVRLLQERGHRVRLLRNLPRRGPAQQRHFLLEHARAGASALFLDDDVLLEPDLMARLHAALRRSGCGFVGSALLDLRGHADAPAGPHEMAFWDGPVLPERLGPASPGWLRQQRQGAGDLWHSQRRHVARGDDDRLYKLAWLAGCVLYDTAKLRGCGGFDFWPLLPVEHFREDALAQLRVMAVHGGCGLLPSGAYRQSLAVREGGSRTDAVSMWSTPASVGSGNATC